MPTRRPATIVDIARFEQAGMLTMSEDADRYGRGELIEIEE